VAAVIERAGVGSATLYRRYPTKVDLVVAALQCVVVERVDTDTGTLLGDVAAFIRQSAASLAARAEFTRISVDISADPQLSATFKEKLLAPRLSELNGILHRAADRGEMSKAKVPSPEVAFSLVIGPVHHRAMVLQEPLTPAFLRAAANAAYAGLVGVPTAPSSATTASRAKA
jgi:AcrR family transcriptional regulator